MVATQRPVLRPAVASSPVRATESPPNPAPPSREHATPTPLVPTLDEILTADPDEFVAKYDDIAANNLACAVGLPGTEALDVNQCLATLAEWTARIALLTNTHLRLFRQRRGEFENSEPLWRVCCIARVLEQDCGIHYCPEEMDKSSPADWKQSDRHLIHGLLGPRRHGTCASLPVLLVAIGRRLGYPMKLVHSPGHVFTRWDGLDHPHPAWRERRNFEFSGGLDSRPDKHYHHSPVEWTPGLHAAEKTRSMPLYLRSLTPAEEVAAFLVQRGHALEEHHSFPEAWAVYVTACSFAPHDDAYQFHAKQCHQRHLDHVLKRWGLTGALFCRLVEMRLRGGPRATFPWERADGEPIPGIHPYCDPRTAAPLIAAERAVAQRIGHPKAMTIPPHFVAPHFAASAPGATGGLSARVNSPCDPTGCKLPVTPTAPAAVPSYVTTVIVSPNRSAQFPSLK